MEGGGAIFPRREIPWKKQWVARHDIVPGKRPKIVLCFKMMLIG
jgi:hypothetical protein